MAEAGAHSPAPFSYEPATSEDLGGFRILDANGRMIGWAESEADARLFSTSAEILEALKAYRVAANGSDAVISKAEG